MMANDDLKALRKKADEALVARAAAKQHLAACRTAVNDWEEEYYAAEEAQQVVQAVAETIQEEAHERIAGVVTRCLAAVFDDPYEFKINFERARGRTEARLTFVRDGMEVQPLDASGGGPVDVAAFALRLAALLLARPHRRRVMVLDEPFKFVSVQYRGRVRAMLEGLAADFGVQFLVITHIEELVCGKVVQIT